MKWGAIARDTLLIFILTALGGFLIGFVAAVDGKEASMALIGASNIGFSILGFTVSGSLTRKDRPKHLLIVAGLVWVLSLVNLFMGISFGQWLGGGIIILFSCVVGGGIATLLFRAEARAV